MFNHKYELEHIFSFGAALETEAIGPVAEGIRVNFYCQGGEVTGPKLQGCCRSVGATGSRFARTGLRSLMSAQPLKAMTEH